jgi:hypothetical protein
MLKINQSSLHPTHISTKCTFNVAHLLNHHCYATLNLPFQTNKAVISPCKSRAIAPASLFISMGIKKESAKTLLLSANNLLVVTISNVSRYASQEIFIHYVKERNPDKR